MLETKKLIQGALINAIIKKFDDVEEESGKDFHHAKKIILKLAKKLELF